jgi:hypothetical protein
MSIDCVAVAFVYYNGNMVTEVLLDVGFKTYQNETEVGDRKYFDLDEATSKVFEKFGTKDFVLFAQHLELPDFTIVENGDAVDMAIVDSSGFVENELYISNGWVIACNQFADYNNDVFRDIFIVVSNTNKKSVSVDFAKTESEAIRKARSIAYVEFKKFTDYETEFDGTTKSGYKFCYKFFVGDEVVYVFKSSEASNITKNIDSAIADMVNTNFWDLI